MQALVTINGTPLPEPSYYNANSSTIVDGGRNAEGFVIGSVIRKDVSKVEVKWRYLTAEQWASVLQCFIDNFYCDVMFYNQSIGGYSTRRMYVSDRDAGMWRRDPNTGEVMGWTECSLSLVEV